jgi:hypothetical protein
MRTWIARSIAGLLLTITAACGGDPIESGTNGSGGSGGSASSSSAMTAGSGGSGGADPGEVPTSPMELFAYLKAGGYLGYPGESAPHASAGPHGGEVRTYITPSLDASLKANDAEHPIHAAAVKELYLGSATVQGWAVMVKIQDTSDGGKGWYWYETFNATDPSKYSTAGSGVPLCYNCHAAGEDFFRSPFPLQ